MNVQAIWENGVFRPLQPISIKHAILTIVVPDEEVEVAASHYVLPKELSEQAQAMLAKMDAIRNTPLPPDEELPELTEKQLNNIEAFELRAQLRLEQGRPV